VNRRRVRWCEWVAVVGLALLVGAAQCGHDEANGDEGASTQTTAEEAESSGDEESEGAAGESERTGQQTEDGMMRSDKQRISNPDVDASTVEALAADNAAFGLDLYGELKDRKSGQNLFYSPYNLSHVMAMAYGGARGETASQMKQTLRWELSDDRLHPAFNMLDAILQKEVPRRTGNKGGDEEATDALETANGVWSQHELGLKDAYLDLLASHYGTGIHPVDFREAPEKARTAINDWAEDRTHGKIDDLMPEGSVHPQTRMVLTAAIYFRGQWSSTFDEKKTAEEAFTNLSGGEATVEMMHQKVRRGWSYLEGNNYQAVELPYGRGAYGMVVIVPGAGELEAVESALDAEFVQTIFDDLEGTAVDLKLPKFELSAELSAKKALTSLGMTTAFTKEADFRGMTADEQIFVDDVLHKAWVSVDEKGTEAAAASAAAMRATSLQPGEPEWKSVRVDRPFLFMIRHTDTDAVLFAGRVVSL